MGDCYDMDKIKLRLNREIKRETRKIIIKEVGQAYQVTRVLKLRAKKDKTITRERGILSRLFKRIVTPQRDKNDIKPKVRKIGDDRSHQIYRVQWKL